MSNKQHAPLSVEASVDLTDKMYRAVVLDGAGVNLPAAGARILGVLMTEAKAGKAVLVESRQGSRAIAHSGEALARPNRLKSDAQGRFVKAADNEDADAICFTGAAAADRRISVVLLRSTAGTGAEAGAEDIVVPTNAPSALIPVSFFSFTGTQTAALPNGTRVGQRKLLVVDEVAGTPVGTITGAFLSQAGVAGTTLNFNAAGDSADLVWNGTAWRVIALNSVTLT